MAVGRRGRQAPAICLDDVQRRELEQIARSAVFPYRDVIRARIVLGAADDMANVDIADSLRVHEQTVGKWRRRFATAGIEGLKDVPRPGRPPVYSSETRHIIIATACDVPRDYRAIERETWTVLSLRDALLEQEVEEAISASTIWRILNAAEFKPHRMRYWLHSKDPAFKEKVTEICNLYLNPPRGSIVLSIDEKTSIQALERKYDTKLPRPRRDGRYEFEYIRHGTKSLLAAFEVHTGQVFGQVRDNRKAVDLLEFMEAVADRWPDRHVHVIWDNLNIHHGERWLEFNAAHHGRFSFHYTPIHASWVNQVEIFFSILSRRVLRHASFASLEELAWRLLAFIEHWNRHEAKPFRWTFKGYPLQTGYSTRRRAKAA
jgi:transposase